MVLGGTVRGYARGVTAVRYGGYGGTLVVFFADLGVLFTKLVMFFRNSLCFLGTARWYSTGGTVVRYEGCAGTLGAPMAPPQPYHPYRSPYLCTVAKCTPAPPQAYHRTASSVPSICTCTLPASRNVSIHGV